MINILPLIAKSENWQVIQFNTPREFISMVNSVAKLTISHTPKFRANKLCVNIRFVNQRYIQHLNKKYRGKDKATNVLSFPADGLPDEFIGVTRELGDIYICMDVINQEAVEQNKAIIDHLAHMVVHGMLHLMGYDHEVESDAVKMEHKEKFILAKLGIEDPY